MGCRLARCNRGEFLAGKRIAIGADPAVDPGFRLIWVDAEKQVFRAAFAIFPASEMRIDVFEDKDRLPIIHRHAGKCRRELPAGNVEQDALGQPAAGGKEIGKRGGEETAVMRAREAHEKRRLQRRRLTPAQPVAGGRTLLIGHALDRLAQRLFACVICVISGLGLGRLRFDLGDGRPGRDDCARSGTRQIGHGEIRHHSVETRRLGRLLRRSLRRIGPGLLRARRHCVAQGHERVDHGRRQPLALDDGARMVGTLRAGDHDQHVVGQCRGRGEEGGGNRNRLAGNEGGNRERQARALRERCNRFATSLHRGAGKERLKQFGKLSEFGLAGEGERLETRDRGHQNDILVPRAGWLLKLPELFAHHKPTPTQYRCV